ncbi:hypothetical protein [Streptomyces sp. NPDC051684]|uniref:hypothetical protein n=1 Tax=Streptomyces sp. NPDC051684 TaxID=3365670 RepID=UPI003797BBAF
MELVRMAHPELPDQDVWVQPIQVKAYKRAGWVVVNDDGSPVETAAAAQGRPLEEEED